MEVHVAWRVSICPCVASFTLGSCYWAQKMLIQNYSPACGLPRLASLFPRPCVKGQFADCSLDLSDTVSLRGTGSLDPLAQFPTASKDLWLFKNINVRVREMVLVCVYSCPHRGSDFHFSFRTVKMKFLARHEGAQHSGDRCRQSAESQASQLQSEILS